MQKIRVIFLWIGIIVFTCVTIALGATKTGWEIALLISSFLSIGLVQGPYELESQARGLVMSLFSGCILGWIVFLAWRAELNRGSTVESKESECSSDDWPIGY
jgi:hypothetical protein